MHLAMWPTPCTIGQVYLLVYIYIIYIYIYWESSMEMIFTDFREFLIMKIFYIATADYNVK